MPLPYSDLKARLKQQALDLGFDKVGVAPAIAPPHYPQFLQWLDDGHAAGMRYLHANAHLRAHPNLLLENARSVVIVMAAYGAGECHSADSPLPATSGRVARYARGDDYHPLFWRRLESLLTWLKTQLPTAKGRAVCDSAPLLERDFATLAGLGWIAKNTMLINRQIGSYTLLGALLLDVELPPDEPHTASHCGTCTRCLEACPTTAFPAPGVLDANRCISYWTIEHRGSVPDDMAQSLKGWAFGCDICQEVCPWNRKGATHPCAMPELASRPSQAEPNLLEWLNSSPTDLKRQMADTALSRARPAGLLRNAALVLGQRQMAEAVPALTRCLQSDHPTVREAAAWALAKIENAERAKPPTLSSEDLGPTTS